MNNALWQKDLFINENIPYIFNREITEYDMSDAGFSLIQEFKLLPEKEIKELQKLGKQQRKVKIGLIQREDDKLKENLKISFQEDLKLVSHMQSFHTHYFKDLITYIYLKKKIVHFKRQDQINGVILLLV